MPYLYNTAEEQQEMLQFIGAASLDELFSDIPSDIQMDRPLNLPPALNELALTQHMTALGNKNLVGGEVPCFLGGGSYDHFIPSVVDAISSRGEFYTSYTPYQPEVSQGNLQAIFEYQTLICNLTGMDVSNASLYDGGSAALEATLMAMRATRRTEKVVTVSSVHPEYRQILETYYTTLNVKLETVEHQGGRAPLEALENVVDEKTACILIQSPNFFGSLEDVEKIAEIAHAKGALLVVAFDPISLGLIKRPGDQGADIAVAEGHTLGTPMHYGGPFLGILACREKLIRNVPGRIAGETVDKNGKRCFVLTLQTREQHIRREKATSNICTNQGLFALRACVYLSTLGPAGLKEVATASLQKAHYAFETLTATDRFEPLFDHPFVKEFVIRDRENKVDQLIQQAAAQGYLAGIPLGNWYPELGDCLLLAVTEKRTKQEIDTLTEILTNTTSLESAHA
ncbi:MAG: aminomethyl-transferring glycine dehydrogenase subunit GcvPA [Pirellulaceae bacterium]|nr:aminomethyl-transferring glycine dehydrogenase subunit GcvPA [Pirellulaceae bacterium]